MTKSLVECVLLNFKILLQGIHDAMQNKAYIQISSRLKEKKNSLKVLFSISVQNMIFAVQHSK